MKKVLAVVLSVIIVLLGLPCRAFADVQYIQAYSVSQGFANSQNETDGWSYAFAPPGTNNYGLFNHFYSFAGGEWWSYDSANNWAYGRMGMWQCAPADAMDVAYVFTLPADGIYALSSESGIKLGEYGNGINAAIFKNNTMIWPQNNNWQPVAPGETINYDSFSISGKQGEKIYFRVNSGGNAANDNTEWNAVITQTGTVYDATIDPEILQNAKMSDYFGDTQLNGHWSYQFADAGSNNYQQFNHWYTFNDLDWWSYNTDNNWDYGRIGRWQLAPSSTRDVAYGYTLFRDGKVNISSDENSIYLNNYGDGARVAVYKNEVKIWPANQEWVELEKGTKVDFGTLEISCKQGDTLHFRVNCGSGQNAVDDNVTWNPIVKYTSFVYEKETDPESNNIPPKTSAMAEIPVAGSIAAAGFWSYGYAIGETYTSYDEVNALYWTKAGNLYNRYGYFSFAWNTVTPGWEADNAFTYTMPKDGTIAILGNEETIAFHPDKFGSLDVNISVYKNDIRIWPLEKEYERISAKEDVGDAPLQYSFARAVLSGKAGDKIHFRVNSGDTWSDADSIQWSPTVQYLNLDYIPETDPENTMRYEYTKGFSSTQWANNWGYLYSGIGDELALAQRDQYDGIWAAGAGNYTTGMIGQNIAMPGPDNDAIIAFKAPVSGNISIRMSSDKISLISSAGMEYEGDGAAVGIYKNSNGNISSVWPAEGMLQLANGQEVVFDEMKMDIRKNEYLWFRLNRGAQQNWHDTIIMLPIITYNTQNLSDEGIQEGGNTGGSKIEAGANPNLLPEAVSTQPVEITTDELIILLKNKTANGNYILNENVTLGEDFNNTTLNGTGVKISLSGAYTFTIAAKNLTLEKFTFEQGTKLVLAGQNNVILNSIVGSLIDLTNDGSWVENCILSDVKIEVSNSVFMYNDIGSSVLLEGGGKLQNILLAKNKLSDSTLAENTNNLVLLGNIYNQNEESIHITDATNITIAENIFASESTPIYLEKTMIALITGNRFLGTTSANDNIVKQDLLSGRVYGGNIPGNGNVHAGVDESCLPQIDTQRFEGMQKQNTVRIAGKEMSMRAYISSLLAGGREVIIPPGFYSTANLNFTGIQDFELFGYGVYLCFPNYTQMAITITGSENVKIKGVFIDHAEVANAQGSIISKGDGYFVWKADAGYLQNLLDSSKFTIANGASPSGEAFRQNQDKPFADVWFGKVEATQNAGEFKLIGSSFEKINIGDKIVFRGKTAHVCYFTESKDIFYEDVTIFNGSGFGMMEYGGYGNTRFNRVAFTPGPKPQEATEERLISTCDATHSTNMRIGIQVTNSLFEKMTDDATNVNGTYGGAQTFNTVTKELVYGPGPKSFISINADFEPGDIVYIYTSTGKLLCQTTAASSSTNIGGGNKRVTLAQDANFEIIAGVTLVVNASANGGGFLYDNCLVQNNRSRGFLIKAPNGKITNCTLRSNGMSAILVKPEISDNWGECSFAQNLEITNNIIEGSGYFTGSELHSPINIAADSTPTDNPLYQNHKNITISGNVFRGRYTSYAITASGVDGLSITNNTFEGRVREYAEFTTPLINPIGPLDDTVPPIKLSGAQNVIVAGNIYPQSTELKVFADESVKNLYGDDVTEYNSDKIAFILRPVFIGDSWKLQLQITNKTALPVSGEARISMPSTLGYATTVGFTDLAAGATVTKYLSVLVENPLAVPVIISYSLSDGTNGIASATISFLSAVNTENSQISIDGAVNDGEWQLTSTILLNNQQAAEKLNQWNGSNDTSARLKFRWDNEYLYVLADVQDDVHAQSNTNAADLWNGDSVQISIDSGRHNEVAGAHGYAELGFALGNDGKMYAYMWNNTITGADTQFDNTLQYAIIRNELDQKTIYEIAIPWKNIGLNQNPPTFGDTIGIAVIVNEDDGSGRRGYLRMFDGIGSGKHPELFGVMQMQDIYSENSVKTELVALISMAENINKKNYSEVSWNFLQIQLFMARQINALNYATADEISYAIDNLARAMDDLVKQSNKIALENLITRAEKLCSADYTPKSWEAFANTLASAMQIVNNIHSSETELKQAFMNLKQAFAKLVKVNHQQSRSASIQISS